MRRVVVVVALYYCIIHDQCSMLQDRVTFPYKPIELVTIPTV